MNVQNDRNMSVGPYGTYDLSQLSVLVAEDSQAARELITSTLKDIGVGTVRKVANGLQAIEYLKGTRGAKGNSLGGSNPPVDLLITDLEMEPVDGVTLTRWVRRHADSPNHFMRAMIISGSLNIGRINMGRNAGVHDFIAKPFTLNSMRDRLHSAIHNYRPFVLTQEYFGPDRRRHTMPKGGEDKRSHPDPVREKNGPDGMVEGIRVFDVPNYLEAIVTGTSEGNLNYVKLRDAESQSAAWMQDYADWILPHIILMKRGLALARESEGGERVRNLEAMRRHVIEVEGIAGYLDYPLLGKVGRALLGVLDAGVLDRDAQARALEHHIEALLIIARDHMKGDGGAAGETLIANLTRLGQPRG